jgi:hypothetical protein
MIYDCFHFNGEYDLLKIRLNHHAGFVDKFVITESPWTYSGSPKPLYYYLVADEPPFDRFKDKIIHRIYNEPPDGRANWEYEHEQRNSIRHFPFKDEDLILYLDCDEIIRNEGVIYTAAATNCIVTLDMKLCWYYFNCVIEPGEDFYNDYSMEECFNHRWKMGKIIRPHHLHEFENVYQIRQANLWNPGCTIPDAGWHFSNLGDPERIHAKFNAFSHSRELNEKYDITPELIRMRKSGLKDPLGRDVKFTKTKLDVPQYVHDNIEKFKECILD